MTKKPKIKSLEIAYRAWLRKVFKEFGRYTNEQIAKAITEDKSLTPEMIEYFFSKINFNPISKTFNGVFEQNQKYYNEVLKESINELFKLDDKKIKNLVLDSFPQMLTNKAFTPGDILNKKKSFFELEKDIIKAELINNYTKRKNQLDEFRQSFLFNNPDKLENFKDKYPEPKYKFADTTGRTQVNNLNRDLSAVFATNLGAQEFTWLTSDDERVRPTHKVLNNKKFSYDDMPSEYNDYNCRCTLVPILSSIPGMEELRGIA